MERLGDMERTAKEILDTLKKRTGGPESNNVNTVRIDAGGAGLWISSTCCAVMLVALLIGGMWASREFTRYDVALSERKEENDRAQTYLSSIYGRMPQWMREEVEKEASSKLEAKEKKNAK